MQATGVSTPSTSHSERQVRVISANKQPFRIHACTDPCLWPPIRFRRSQANSGHPCHGSPGRLGTCCCSILPVQTAGRSRYHGWSLMAVRGTEMGRQFLKEDFRILSSRPWWLSGHILSADSRSAAALAQTNSPKHFRPPITARAVGIAQRRRHLKRSQSESSSSCPERLAKLRHLICYDGHSSKIDSFENAWHLNHTHR